MTSSADSLCQVGIADQAAIRLGNTIRTIAGVGTSQALGANITVNSALLTTSGGATAFKLPTTWQVGDDVTVFNTSSTTALLYPQVGGAINGGSTDAAISIAQNTGVLLRKMSATSWRAIASNAGTGTAFTDITVDGITGTDASLGVTGLAAAQGGAVAVVGGTSSTAGNAGGAFTAVGGTPGATGVGGAVTLTAGAGGATSGTGGAASLKGGAGTNGNAVGGAATVTGGAGNGTGTGGAASLVGGASGAGATGNGAAANVTGGAALSSNGSGGSVVLTGGAKTGTGVAGAVRTLSVALYTQSAPAAKTTTTTLTAAELLGGLITANQGAAGAATYTMPLGTDLAAALPADLAVGDSFQFSIINISTNAAEIVTVAGNTGTTAVGNMTIAANGATTSQSSGTFVVRNTGAGTFSFYKIA
jgi:hypothetical protein